MDTDLAAVEIYYATALGDRLGIRNKRFFFEEQTGFSGNMEGPSANFTAVRTTRQAKLKDADLKALVDVFYTNHFDKLTEGYGAWPEDRSYPETLRYKDNSVDKIVVYRENPHLKDQPKPQEFDTIVAAILALKNKYFNQN